MKINIKAFLLDLVVKISYFYVMGNISSFLEAMDFQLKDYYFVYVIVIIIEMLMD